MSFELPDAPSLEDLPKEERERLQREVNEIEAERGED